MNEKRACLWFASCYEINLCFLNMVCRRCRSWISVCSQKRSQESAEGEGSTQRDFARVPRNERCRSQSHPSNERKSCWFFASMFPMAPISRCRTNSSHDWRFILNSIVVIIINRFVCFVWISTAATHRREAGLHFNQQRCQTAQSRTERTDQSAGSLSGRIRSTLWRRSSKHFGTLSERKPANEQTKVSSCKLAPADNWMFVLIHWLINCYLLRLF